MLLHLPPRISLSGAVDSAGCKWLSATFLGEDFHYQCFWEWACRHISDHAHRHGPGWGRECITHVQSARSWSRYNTLYIQKMINCYISDLYYFYSYTLFSNLGMFPGNLTLVNDVTSCLSSQMRFLWTLTLGWFARCDCCRVSRGLIWPWWRRITADPRSGAPPVSRSRS